MRTKNKVKSWPLALLLATLGLCSCNPDDYTPEEEYNPEYPETTTQVETRS